MNVTIVPPSAEDVLSPLRAQVDDLLRDLTDGGTPDALAVPIKQRIFLLHRSVEQHAQLIEILQAEVRMLVDTWKHRYASLGTSSLTPLSTAAIPVAATATAQVSPAAAMPTETAAIVSAPGAPSPSGPPSGTAPVAVRVTPAIAAAERPQRANFGTPTTTFGAPAAGVPRVIDELNASTFVERGWSKIATGDFIGAEAALDKALTLNPGDPNAESLLGWAQMGQGKLDAALAILQQVLDRVPDHALAMTSVGYIHLRRKNFELATEYLTRAIAFDSDRKAMLYAHYYLGLVRFEQARFAEAIGELLRAIELGPNLIEARFELGRVFWFAERTDDAIAAWRKGADLNKFNPWSTRCREMLSTIADGGAPSRVS